MSYLAFRARRAFQFLVSAAWAALCCAGSAWGAQDAAASGAHAAPTTEVRTSYSEAFASAWTSLESNDLTRARVEYERCLDLSPKNSIVAYHLACIEGRLGRRDAGIGWLKNALEWGYMDSEVARTEPDFAALRDEPRFDRILKRMGDRAQLSVPVDAVELVHPFESHHHELSPNGRRLVSIRGRHAQLLDVATGNLVAVLGAGSERVGSATFTPASGKIIVHAIDSSRSNDDRYLVYDAWSGTFVRELEGPVTGYDRLRVSADGRRLLAAGGSPRSDSAVWDLETGAVIQRLPAGSPDGMAFSSDGAHVVIADTHLQRVLFYDVHPFAKVAEIPLASESALCAGFSARSDHVCVVERAGGRISVYHGRSGELVRTILASGDWVRACWMTLDGQRIVTAGNKTALASWSVETGACEWRLEHGALEFEDVEPTPDHERCLVSDAAGGVRLIDLASGAALWESAPGLLSKWATGVSFDAGGELVALETNAGVQVHSTRTGVPAHALVSPPKSVGTWVSTPSASQVLTLDRTGRSRLIDLQRATSLTSSAFDTGSDPTSFQVSRDGKRTCLVTQAGEVRVVRSRFGGAILRVGGAAQDSSDAVVTDGSMNPVGSRLLTWSSGASPTLWDLDIGAAIAPLAGHERGLGQVTWSDDGTRCATLDGVGRVRIWNATTAGLVVALAASTARSACMAFDPAGERLGVGSDDGTARVFDAGSGQVLFQLSHADQDTFGGLTIACVAWRPDGTELVTTTHSLGALYAWKATDGSPLWRYDYGGGNGSTLWASYSRDGQRLCLSGQTDRTPRLVNARDGSVLLDLSQQSIGFLGESDDGQRLVAECAGSLAVFDRSEARPLWSHVETRAGGELWWTPSGHFHGTCSALREVAVVLDGATLALRSYAPCLWDPKRIAAAARGVRVAAPTLPPPPQIRLENVDEGIHEVVDDTFELVVEARDAVGVRAIELEAQGQSVSRTLPLDLVAGQPTHTSFVLRSPARGSAFIVSVRVIATNGLESRTALIEVVRAPGSVR